MSGQRKPALRKTPRPFLKWVGGKTQLLNELLANVERAGDFGRYHEPFVGGGALFFELLRLGRLPRKRAWLSDNNERLIDVYEGIKSSVDKVIPLLRSHEEKHSEGYFYEVRSEVPESLDERAARLIYLNKTCYNGLFRENSKGLFNTPFGRYKNPLICDAENLKKVSAALERAKLQSQNFLRVLANAKKGDLVYMDPPYQPLSKTASFTSYDKNGFGEDDQRALADVVGKLVKKNVNIILSNSNTPLIKELYPNKRFTIQEVQANRSVNSKATGRGKITELIITNF